MSETAKKNAQGMVLTADVLKDMISAIIKEVKGDVPEHAEHIGLGAVHTYIPAEQEMVEVNLFRDNGKYKDDVLVVLNGKNIMVPRGKRVMVPAGVKEILETSMAQDLAVEGMLADKETAWESKVKDL